MTPTRRSFLIGGVAAGALAASGAALAHVPDRFDLLADLNRELVERHSRGETWKTPEFKAVADRWGRLLTEFGVNDPRDALVEYSAPSFFQIDVLDPRAMRDLPWSSICSMRSARYILHDKKITIHCDSMIEYFVQQRPAIFAPPASVDRRLDTFAFEFLKCQNELVRASMRDSYWAWRDHGGDLLLPAQITV